MVTNDIQRVRSIKTAGERKKGKHCRQNAQNCEKNKTQHIGGGAPERHRHIKTFNIINHKCSKQ